MTPDVGLNTVRSVREVTVVAVTYLTGDGTPGNPFREIVGYYAPTGELLAEHDEWSVSTHDGSPRKAMERIA